MASPLYAKDGKIYCKDYMEVYIPKEYFANGLATNEGNSIETLGIVYARVYENGNAGKMQLINLPASVKFNNYDFEESSITIHGKTIDVMVLKYLKDSYVIHQTLTNGREVAEAFLSMVLGGKVPKTLRYEQILDMWWKNLEISGISFKVPSKMFELIIAAIYRNPNNVKERFGQLYGKEANPDGSNYKTDNVRNVVKNLSTFSGIVFEDISSMLTSAVNNSTDGVEEPISPLEKIIYY